MEVTLGDPHLSSYCPAADRKCHSMNSKRRTGIGVCVRKKCKRSSELAFAAPWLVPSPEYFAKLKAYWLSGRNAWQVATVVAPAPAGSTRTTASSNEQKARMPVWFSVTGLPFA